MNTSSISQIVQSIIGALSDGVSELILIVVVLAEQNADIPLQLPLAATNVNKTAKALSDIARQLAKTNYADFPEIAKEIVDASNFVDFSVNNLSLAVQTLQETKDKKQGWNSLIDSCRTMAGSTIRLLLIVYGADLKRLRTCVSLLSNDLKSVSSLCHLPLHTKEQQTLFAGNVRDFAQKLNKFSGFLGMQANEQQNPVLIELLEKMSERLKHHVTTIVTIGNGVLQNPGLMHEMEEMLEKIEKDMDRANQIVNICTLGELEDQQDMDLGDLLGTAGDLSKFMRNLIGKLPSTVEKTVTEVTSQESRIHSEKNSLEKCDQNNLPKIMEKVAQNIHICNTRKQKSLWFVETEDLVQELHNLAKAAANGKKKGKCYKLQKRRQNTLQS